MSPSFKRFPPGEGTMKTLPPGSGLVIAVAFSLLIWACIASIFIIL